MGMAVAQTVRSEEDFSQKSFEYTGRNNTRKTEIIKIQQRDFALELDRKEEVGNFGKEKKGFTKSSDAGNK